MKYGVLISGGKFTDINLGHVLNTEVSLFQGCPLRDCSESRESLEGYVIFLDTFLPACNSLVIGGHSLINGVCIYG